MNRNYNHRISKKGFGDSQNREPKSPADISMAVTAHRRGELEKAKALYQDAINRDSNNVDALHNLSLILRDEGRLEESEGLLRKCLEQRPKSIIVLHSLAKVLLKKRDYDAAELAAQQAHVLNQTDVSIMLTLANIHTCKSHFGVAVKVLKQGLSVYPQEAELYRSLGAVYAESGMLEESLHAFRQALIISPHLTAIRLDLGIVYKRMGLAKEARECFRRLLQDDPFNANAHLQLSQYKEHIHDQLLREDLLDRSADRDRRTKEISDINFARANIYHAEARFEEAAVCLEMANQKRLLLLPSDREVHIGYSRRVFSLHNKSRQARPSAIKTEARYIFIVGMPRCGSTLLETILDCNPQATGLGETEAFRHVANTLNILEPKESSIVQIEELYRRFAGIESSTHKYYIDKRLPNYMYAGFIAENFRNARVIYCTRHPLDNILSLYRANLAQGSYYCSSIEDSARVLVNQAEIMMAYAEAYPDSIYQISYDRLVRSPKKGISELIQWLDWPWHDLYLKPEDNNRAITTASVVQVRSPINCKSVGGWKNYRKLLEPAIRILSESGLYPGLLSD